MKLTNATAFSPFIFEAYGPKDELLNVVICRGTFDLQSDGRLTISSDQSPVILADQYRTDPLVSSVQVDTDLVPHKFVSDITLNAIAHAPHTKPSTNWDVSIRIGEITKSLRVTGPRHWRFSNLIGWQLSAAEPTMAVPLQFEYAFGGSFRRHDEQVVFDPNPVGLGFADPRHVDRRLLIPAAQIEQCDSPIKKFGEIYEPVGVGPIAKHWLPRRNLCGTADDLWKETRWPLRPLDFDFSYYNSSPNGLRYPGYLSGAEEVFISGCSPEREISFNLPGIRLGIFATDVRMNLTVETMFLDTLHIDLVSSKVYCTWRRNFRVEAMLDTLLIIPGPNLIRN